MNTDNPLLPGIDPHFVKPHRFTAQPHEYRVTSLRECPTPESMQLCDTPDGAATYLRLHIATASAALAPLITAPCYLVPVPDSKGSFDG